MDTALRLTTNSSRLTVLGLYALGIILVATYTANLSSFLTLTRAQPLITGIDDIKNGRLPFSRIGIVTNSAASDYYMQNVSLTYRSLSNAEEMYQRLLDQTIDASIWDSSVIEYTVNNYNCGQLTVVGNGFVKSSYAIALPKDWLYKRDLDVHILAIREAEKLEKLENMWLKQRQCSSTTLNDMKDTNDPNVETFSLDVMYGLFLSFIMITAVAFGVHLWYSRGTIVTTFCHISKQLKLSS